MSLPWQPGSVVVEFDWHHSIARPRKPPDIRKHLRDISHTSRVIAYFVSNFVAMRTSVGRSKFKWHRWIGRPRKPYSRTQNYESMLYTTEVMTVWIIFKFSPFGAHCNFFWIFEINNLIVKFKFSNAQKAIHCAKPRHMSHRALKSVQSFLLQAAKRKGKGWVGKVQKVTKALYFTYSWGSPLWTDFNQILHVRRYGGRNHLCKFGYGQIEGFGKYGGQSLGSSVETTGHPYNSAALQHSLRLLSSSSSSSLKCVCVANM